MIGNVYRGSTESFGAVCYSISFKGATFLAEIAFPIKYATDGITNWLTAPWTSKHYSGFVVLPTPVWPYRYTLFLLSYF